MSLRTASEVTAGLLLILEGAAIAFVAVTFLVMGAPGAGLGWLVFLMVFAGACLAWAGAVLAGFLRLDGRPAAFCTLIVGGLLSVLVHGLMLVANCGGGVNCPSTMPSSVYITPIALAAFNVAAVALLWFKRPKQPR